MSGLPLSALPQMLGRPVVVTCAASSRIFTGSLAAVAHDGSVLLGGCQETRVVDDNEGGRAKITRSVGIANIKREVITGVYMQEREEVGGVGGQGTAVVGTAIET
mmetsp:Transcript_15441/g.30791  ORF Transcript_15441/g.30791 Transcript_15441/m.30791 type:complete len:105 (+) Transcript_15441:376-690(+)|eukprot:CAMPEP_0182458334 /NCGR_PEP_ID=MMETSP1319-20130603/3696_1 /TAXON_ID=172717 /ORGANISM="Bolidomonas pacifica, Strain RCC208" /LENGTH=104 /DNA_ID=CAMNT_0024656999 /DNA_START=366 /DNA_END=680 /DNA_ORIENTATION=-